MRRCVAIALALPLVACGATAPEGASSGTASSSSTSSSSGSASAGTTAPVAIVPSEGALNGPLDTAAIAAAAPPPAVAASPTGAEMISVAPGFRPDPIVRRGQGGGPVPAETIDESCRGYITAEANYLLKVDAALTDLRLLVHMEGDATLVVQLADGSVRCNDDTEGLDPIVDGRFPPGRHRVWVGTYSESGVGTAYTIAFTRQPTVTTRALDGMAVSP